MADTGDRKGRWGRCLQRPGTRGARPLLPAPLVIVIVLDAFAATIGASETLFAMYNAEEDQSGAQSQVAVKYGWPDTAIASHTVKALAGRLAT
jgi:hypothetical protein